MRDTASQRRQVSGARVLKCNRNGKCISGGPANVIPAIRTFRKTFFHALWTIRGILLGLMPVLLIDAWAIAYFEKIPFADALYFTFVTVTTIGYGDITPVTLMGRVVAILTGLQGMLITGLITAVAVYALRQSVEHPTDSK